MLLHFFFFFFKKKRTKSGLDKLVWIFPIIAGVLGSAPEEFCNFQSHLSLEKVFSALKLTQTCCINMNICLLENCKFHHKLFPALPHIPEKTIQLFDKNYNLSWYAKILIFFLFHELQKIEKSNQSNIQKSKFSIFP